jgi:amino acid adenylation domain-containing protein
MSREAPIFRLEELVDRHARVRPDAPCVVAPDARASYQEMAEWSDSVAAMLARMGVVRGDRVALYQAKRIETVAAILGILKCGAAYVPIDPAAPPDRATFILEHCGVRVLFAGGRSLAALAKGPKRPRLDHLVTLEASSPHDLKALANDVVPFACALEERARDPPQGRPIPEDLAYVLYTSGSTGTPKGVAVTHAQSLAFVRAASPVFAIGPDDVVASHAPFNFDLSIIDLFSTFEAGARVVVVPETFLAFPARIGKLIADEGISVWNSVPSALVQLVNHGALEELDLSRLRLVMFAGEAFPIKHLRRLHAYVPKARLLNVYGQTEANSSTYFEIARIPNDDDAPLPAGKPFPGYQVLLLDDRGSMIEAPGIEGELYVRGGAIASGYWNDPERTEHAFVQHPLVRARREIVYKTGDRFVYDASMDLVFRGRIDGAVKVRGFRVETAEVERAAVSHASVGEAAVVALADEAAGHRLILFATPIAGAAIDEAELRAHLSARLPRYMLAESICAKSSLPKTATGKIDRSALLEEAKSSVSPLYGGDGEG